MPIAETQARGIGCPYFAGRDNLINRIGFVIHCPEKQYLTTTPTNTASEKGLMSVFNYDLAYGAYMKSSDRVAFQIYTKLGSDAANVTTGRNIHALDVLCSADYDYAVTTSLRNADVRGARIQVYGHHNVSGMCTGAYIACQLKAGYTFDGRLMESISFAGGVGCEVKIETTGTGTVTIGSAGGGAQAFIGLLVSYNGRNALTGNVYSIFLEKPNETGAISGVSTGIQFGEANIYASEVDFDTGIDLADTCVTGIDIGNCTTGITFTGTSTGRAIMVGSFSQASNLTVNSTNNYPVGVFARMTADENITADIRCAWFRLRIDSGVQIGNSANWGNGLKGIQGSLRFYGGSGTGTYSWVNAGVFGSLETDGATKVAFRDGSVSAAVFAHCGLAAAAADDVDIETGAVVAGIAINCGTTTASNVTVDGTFAGLYIYNDVGNQDFTDAIHIACDCTYGINIVGTCATAGIMLDGTNKLMFDDSGMYIRASADGYLEIVSDYQLLLSCTGPNAIAFGGPCDWGAGGGHLIDGTGWDYCTSTVAYLTSGDLGAACAAAYLSLAVNAATHSGSGSYFGIWTELYFEATQVLTGAANAAAIWGQVECGATVTGPDVGDGDFMAAGYFNFKTGASFTTGSYVNGVRIQSEVSNSSYALTGSTWMAGLEILTRSGSYQNWTYGIKIAGSDTGIDFAACTTAAITVGANVALPKFIGVGTWDNWVEWNQTDEFIEYLVESTTAAGSKPMARFRLAGEADANHTGELCAMQVQCYNQGTYDVTDMIGLKVESGFKGAATVTSSGATYGWIGLMVRLEDLDSTVDVQGNAYVAELRTQMFDPSSAFNGESSFLHINNLNDAAAALDSVFYLDDGGGTGQAGVATYLFDFENAVAPFVNDHTHDSEAKEIKCRVDSTDYYIKLYT